jgi:protein involved in polysaccharide export with SLBB domain
MRMTFPCKLSLTRALLVAMVATALSTRTGAQTTGQGAEWASTRDVLSAEVERYRQLAASPAYSEGMRAKASRYVMQLERRLQDGDFRAGDRLMIQVTGSVPVNDTVTVLDGRVIELQRFGSLSVAGVLRSELESKVREFVGTTVRDATVSVRPLVRIAVYGSVGAPGYQAVPLETRIDDLLMLSGGPTSEADPNRMRVMRGDVVVLEPSAVLAAIADGHTVGRLGLQEGDRLTLGERTAPWDRASTLQIVALFVAPLVTILLVR